MKRITALLLSCLLLFSLAKLPRTKYKVCTGKLLMTLELLPDKAVDLTYKAIVR